MIQAAVFFLSLSALAFEVLLARIFAISQWNHLSFMVISLALFGFAASGTVLSLIEARRPGWMTRFTTTSGLASLAALYTTSACVAFLIMSRLPLDYFLLPLEPVQGVYLLVAYLVLALPFFFAGATISVAYSGFPDQIGSTYFATMTGSACGALLPYPLSSLIGEVQLLVLSVCIPLILLPAAAGVLGAGNTKMHHIRSRIIAACSVLIALTAALLFWRHGIPADIDPSDYKALSQTLRLPGARVDWSGGHIRGRIDRVVSPYIRFAPGLSLTYTDELPPQTALFRDADNQTILYGDETRTDLDFARSTLSFAGYHVSERPDHVLIIQNGGGLAIACALASEAHRITVLEAHPHIAQLVGQHYGQEVHARHPRAFLAGNRQRYGVIHVESWGPSIPGAGALDQSFLLTREAITEYVTHLTDNGVVVISGRLRLPPADMIRLWAAARQGLSRAGVIDPEAHLALVRNWDTFTLLATRMPIADSTPLTRFAQRLNFDLVYLKGLQPGLANRYNIFDAPFYFEELSRLAGAFRNGTEQRYFSQYLLDVSPQSDDRPFPNRFLRWDRIGSTFRAPGGRLCTLLLSGEVVIAVVLIEAAVVAALLMGLPLIEVRRAGRTISAGGVLYFLGVGAGFMLTGMYLIYKLVLVLEEPIISMTVVLAALLILSGIGGMLSRRFHREAIPKVLLLLTVLLIATAAGADRLLHGILALPDGLRQATAVGLLVPTGLIMGLPFPMGMQYLLESPLERAYGWAANGCTSVIGSVTAAQLAISGGLFSILIAGIAAYLVSLAAAVAVRRKRRQTLQDGSSPGFL